jgi:hypothetical protein
LEVLCLLVETTATKTLVHIEEIIMTLMGELCHQLLVCYHHISILISYLWHGSYQRWFLEMLIIHKHLLLVLLVLIKHCLVLIYLRAPIVLYLLNSLIISTNQAKLHRVIFHVKRKETSWTLIYKPILNQTLRLNTNLRMITSLKLKSINLVEIKTVVIHLIHLILVL